MLPEGFPFHQFNEIIIYANLFQQKCIDRNTFHNIIKTSQ